MYEQQKLRPSNMNVQANRVCRALRDSGHDYDFVRVRRILREWIALGLLDRSELATLSAESFLRGRSP